MKNIILEVMNRAWIEGSIPRDWDKTIFVPIYKGKGDAGECGNYREISLINHISKLYERILERSVRASIKQRLGAGTVWV